MNEDSVTAVHHEYKQFIFDKIFWILCEKYRTPTGGIRLLSLAFRHNKPFMEVFNEIKMKVSEK